MLLIDAVQRREVMTQRIGIRDLQPAVGKPSPHQRIDRLVMPFGHAVVAFEARNRFERAA